MNQYQNFKNIFFSKEVYKLVKDVLIVNIFISLVALLGNLFSSISLIFSVALIIYLIFESFKRPKRALYLILGIKLTFDMLWYIKLPILNLGMLELVFLPLVIIFFRSRINSDFNFFFKFVLFFSIYLQFAFLINQNFSIEGLFRMSGILIGLLISFILIKEKQDFNLIITFIFISTIFPILLSLIQYLLDSIGLELFFHKAGGVRGKRLSGLYYDPATSGMISIISIISGTYLLVKENFYKKFIYSIIFIAVLLSIIGQTRSILFICFLILTIYFLTYINKSFKALLILTPALFFLSADYFNKIWSKSIDDVPTFGEIEFLLEDEDRSTMLTGRVGIWQKYWVKFTNSSFIEKIVGHGYINGYSHNTYLGLLIHSGILGLILYFLLHIYILMKLFFLSQSDKDIKYISIFSFVSIILIGFSATAVLYTSFQWIIYFIIGSQILLNEKNEYQT